MLARVLALWLALSPALAFAQSAVLNGFPPGTFQSRAAIDASPAGISPSIDGGSSGHASAASTTATLTTTKTNDVIVVQIIGNSGSGNPTVSDVAGLSWTNRSGTATSPSVREYYAVSSGILTADVITVNWTSATFLSIVAFGVNGANLSTPPDTNAGLPNLVTSGSNSVTTTQAFDLITSGFRCSNSVTYTPGAGFTEVPNAGVSGSFLQSQYAIVTTTQSALVVAAGSCTSSNGTADAFQGAVQ